MLNCKTYTKAFRFCRWSRAGYAVFNSLSAVVTIGVLASSITEKSLLKSNKIPTVFSQNHLSLTNEKEHGEDITPEQIAEIAVMELAEDVAAAQNHSLFDIKNRSCRYGEPLCNDTTGFYIYTNLNDYLQSYHLLYLPFLLRFDRACKKLNLSLRTVGKNEILISSHTRYLSPRTRDTYLLAYEILISSYTRYLSPHIRDKHLVRGCMGMTKSFLSKDLIMRELRIKAQNDNYSFWAFWAAVWQYDCG